jgi:hypothetical protein
MLMRVCRRQAAGACALRPIGTDIPRIAENMFFALYNKIARTGAKTTGNGGFPSRSGMTGR